MVHFFTYRYSIIPASFLEKTILSPLNCLWTIVENQLTIYVWVYFWTLFCFIELYDYPSPYYTVMIIVVFQ